MKAKKYNGARNILVIYYACVILLVCLKIALLHNISWLLVIVAGLLPFALLFVIIVATGTIIIRG